MHRVVVGGLLRLALSIVERELVSVRLLRRIEGGIELGAAMAGDEPLYMSVRAGPEGEQHRREQLRCGRQAVGDPSSYDAWHGSSRRQRGRRAV